MMAIKIKKSRVIQIINEEIDKLLLEYATCGGKGQPPCFKVNMGYAVMPAGTIIQTARAIQVAQATNLGRKSALPLAYLVKRITDWFETTERGPELKAEPELKLKPKEIKDLYKDLGIEDIMKINPIEDEEKPIDFVPPVEPPDDDDKREEEPTTWILYPGGFKPPHIDHDGKAYSFFSQPYENVTPKVVKKIIIGSNPRSSPGRILFDAKQSKRIWDLYINTPEDSLVKGIRDKLVQARRDDGEAGPKDVPDLAAPAGLTGVEAMISPGSPVTWIFDSISNGTFQPGDILIIAMGKEHLSVLKKIRAAATVNGISVYWDTAAHFPPGTTEPNMLNSFGRGTKLREAIEKFVSSDTFADYEHNLDLLSNLVWMRSQSYGTSAAHWRNLTRRREGDHDGGLEIFFNIPDRLSPEVKRKVFIAMIDVLDF